jgi:hypothetical protein
MEPELSNKETAEHILEYIKHTHGVFSWCTDGCGYYQHMRFVRHRNANWKGGSRDEYNEFVRQYAETLLNEPEIVKGEKE